MRRLTIYIPNPLPDFPVSLEIVLDQPSVKIRGISESLSARLFHRISNNS